MEVSDSARPGALKRQRSLVQHIVDNLSERIRSGALKPGDKLPTEAEVMKSNNVSRTVVREAISRLHAAGLVQTRHGIGTFVLEPGNTASFGIDPSVLVTLLDVLAIMELRISLETEAAGLAAARRTEDQLAEIRQSIDAFESGVTVGGDTVKRDFEFHVRIGYATGNRYFGDAIRHLGTTIIPRTRINTAQVARDDTVQYLSRINREHEAIYDAIARRDPEAARAAMRTHVGNSRDRLRRAHEAIEAQKNQPPA